MGAETRSRGASGVHWLGSRPTEEVPVSRDEGRGDVFEDGLEQLGFELSGSSRRGGRMWRLEFNRYLTIVLHDYHDAVVLTWSVALGDLAAERGWVLGTGETSFHELYPQHDVKLPISITAVEAELRRVLGTLRIDLADPAL
jgi:hypothetical protein